MNKPLPERANAVVVGGGVVGTSVLFHLAKLGMDDIVLVERKELGCGTTWHAAGLVGQLRSSYNTTQLAKYTSDLFESLARETGQETGFRQNGSLSIAPDESRFEELKRQGLHVSIFWFGSRCNLSRTRPGAVSDHEH